MDPIYKGLFEPQEWNRYAYALNSPLTHSDPDGRAVVCGHRKDGMPIFCDIIFGGSQPLGGGGGGGDQVSLWAATTQGAQTDTEDTACSLTTVCPICPAITWSRERR